MKSRDYMVAKDLLCSGKKVIALLAPTIEKTFRNAAEEKAFYSVLKQIGFESWTPISTEAQKLAELEIKEWEEWEQSEKIIISSCCPMIVNLIEKEYPQCQRYLSKSGSPMYLASQRVKANMPDAVTIFIGPCFGKKMEAERRAKEKGSVDVVLTFSEFAELLDQMQVDFEWDYCKIWKKTEPGLEASGGIMNCVKEKMKRENVEDMPQFFAVPGIEECRKILDGIQEGRYLNSYIECMACEDGCGPKI